MLRDFLKKNIKSQAGADKGGFVEWGYGQVEPNHLSAQRTSQVYAQLPADPEIEVLEQGQFVKYDYANGLVNFTGVGEWMLVYNEIKLYREHQDDCEFAMVKDNYQARIYSPFGGDKYAADGSLLGRTDPYTYDTNLNKQSRYYNGVDSEGKTSFTLKEPTYALTSDVALDASKTYYTKGNDDKYTAVTTPDVANIGTYYEMTDKGLTYAYDDVTAAPDMYEIHYNEDPYHIESQTRPQFMPEGTTMVPRVLKTNVGDIFTTNMVKESSLKVGDLLKVGTDGILKKGTDANFQWQVVKVYTMPDHQRGVKIMRVA